MQVLYVIVQIALSMYQVRLILFSDQTAEALQCIRKVRKLLLYNHFQ